MPTMTPTEKLTICGVPVFVKREDLYVAPIPVGPQHANNPGPPPFAKPRGLIKRLQTLKSQGVLYVAYMDTSISMAGWALAYYAPALGLSPTIFYPNTQTLKHNLPKHIQIWGQLGAEVIPLEQPTQLSINWYRARRRFEEMYPYESHFLPQGLPFKETVEEVAAEVTQVPSPAWGGTVVMAVGSGTMAAGVVTGIIRGVRAGTMHMPKMFVGVPVSRRDGSGLDSTKKAVMRKVIAVLKGQFQHTVRIVPPKYDYEDIPNCPAPPFPCNEYYDLKAWDWLLENLQALPQPVLFWNIGA